MPICDDDEWEECAEYYDLEEGGELPELIVAVTKQDIKTTIHLLDKGQDIEVRSHLANDYGATALIWASSIGDNQIVQLLLKYGARIDHADWNGVTPLMWACQLGHLCIVRTLVANGADVNLKDLNGNTALIYAIDYGYTSVAKYLIEQGADVLVKDINGKDLIDVALFAFRAPAVNGEQDMLTMLLKMIQK